MFVVVSGPNWSSPVLWALSILLVYGVAGWRLAWAYALVAFIPIAAAGLEARLWFEPLTFVANVVVVTPEIGRAHV
jgi:hypothetical protein